MVRRARVVLDQEGSIELPWLDEGVTKEIGVTEACRGHMLANECLG